MQYDIKVTLESDEETPIVINNVKAFTTTVNEDNVTGKRVSIGSFLADYDLPTIERLKAIDDQENYFEAKMVGNNENKSYEKTLHGFMITQMVPTDGVKTDIGVSFVYEDSTGFSQEV